MRARPLPSVTALAMLGLLGVTPARAAPEDEWELGAGAGAALAEGDDQWSRGLALGIEGQRGLSDFTSLRLAVAATTHSVASGSVGLVYALDVLRVVPFAELGVGAAHRWGSAGQPGFHLGLEAGAGALYFLDPRWSLSLVLRYQQGVLRLTGDGSGFPGPGLVSLLVRLSRQL